MGPGHVAYLLFAGIPPLVSCAFRIYFLSGSAVVYGRADDYGADGSDVGTCCWKWVLFRFLWLFKHCRDRLVAVSIVEPNGRLRQRDQSGRKE